jgi:hypothetical protein
MLKETNEIKTSQKISGSLAVQIVAYGIVFVSTM